MKIEIEITEEEIRSAVERKIRVAVADQTNQWGTDSYIKKVVEAKWRDVVEATVMSMLQDSPKMREKIAAEIERKLRSQLSAAMRIKP